MPTSNIGLKTGQNIFTKLPCLNRASRKYLGLFLIFHRRTLNISVKINQGFAGGSSLDGSSDGFFFALRSFHLARAHLKMKKPPIA